MPNLRTLDDDIKRTPLAEDTIAGGEQVSDWVLSRCRSRFDVHSSPADNMIRSVANVFYNVLIRLRFVTVDSKICAIPNMRPIESELSTYDSGSNTVSKILLVVIVLSLDIVIVV